ncbi:MAG: DUF2298 domain-containing protein [Anaerolineae bacterium]
MVLMPLLRWWLLLEVIGVIGLPISMRLLRFLPERGACFRRPVGLLLSAYGLWLLVSLGLLQNTTAAAALSVCLVACVSLALVWHDRRALGDQLYSLRRVILLESVLFLASVLLFGLFRAYNPEIAATEKPMEYAFLNGILQSRTFPPQDPWLSGYSISYYYFGYLQSAMLTRLAALPSDITFNLTGISLFALTVSGSFALVYDLVVSSRTGGEAVPAQGAARFGFLGAALVAIMGNLVGVLELVRARGLGSEALWRWFDVRNLGASLPSATWYPDDMWWWWRASRVIHDRDLAGATQEVISEFPFFSFLLGDNHPHVLALPFVLLALALALNVLLTPKHAAVDDALCEESGERKPRIIAWLQGWHVGPIEALSWGLILGALAFLNTWDYPIYLALFAGALALARYRHSLRGRAWLSDAFIMAFLLGVVGLVAYLPFFISLRSQAGGVGLVPLHIKTPVQQFLLMFGVQLALVSGLLAAVIVRWGRNRLSDRPPALALAWAVLLGAATFAALLAAWWTAALCLFLLALAGTLLLWGAVLWARRAPDAPGATLLFVLLMLVAALALLAAVEFVYLRDVFDSRMNTVFKFYYQGWVLLSLVGAYGAHYVLHGLHSRSQATPVLRYAWALFCTLLILGGLGYTAAATVSKAGSFAGTPTLDGTAYVARDRPMEYAVAEWLTREAEPDAVMVEAAGASYTTSSWVSAHTGLRSLLGWAGHERQWRGSGTLPAEREEAVRTIYTGVDQGETRRLLELYGVDYVLVGPHEREQYSVGDLVLAKFDALMVRAFENDVYVVYARGW